MTNSNGLTQVLGELEKELKRLKAAADHIGDAREAATNAAEVARNLVESSATLANAAEALIDEIDGVDFPKLLGNLDLRLENVKLQLKDVERNLSDELKASREALLNEIKELAQQQSAIQKRVKQNSFLFIVIAVLVLVVLLLQFAL